jgi:peptide/nickel transport system permease protein
VPRARTGSSPVRRDWIRKVDTVTSGSALDLTRQARTSESFTRASFRRIVRQPTAVAGAAVLLILVLAAIFAPVLTSHDPAGLSPLDARQPPSSRFLLGTDHFGRDQLTRILFGGRLSLRIGLIAVAIGASVGITIGAVAGYAGGWTDELITRFLDIMLAFPGILLAVAVVAVLGPNLTNLMIAVGVGTIPGFARLTRGQVLAAREFDYVLAARCIGATHRRVLARHILPNIAAPVVVFATLAIAGAILAGASLNYLGFGTQPPTPEWGLMLSEARHEIRRAWWLATVPGVMIMITVISINLVGDGLRDAFDPWLRQK